MLDPFLFSTAIALWIAFLEGADELEGNIAAAFLTSPLAPMLSASLLRLYVAGLWVLHLVLLLVRSFP